MCIVRAAGWLAARLPEGWLGVTSAAPARPACTHLCVRLHLRLRMRRIQYISPMRYAFIALAKNEFTGLAVSELTMLVHHA